MTGKLFIKTFMLLAFIAVFASCVDKNHEADSNVIPRDVMIEILADIQIFESTQQILKDKNQSVDETKRRKSRYPEIFAEDSTKAKDIDEKKQDFDLIKVYKWVFDHYQVTEQSFRESVDHYSNNPEEFEAIYDEVLIRISEKQAKITSS